jgi:transcriptional regulator NrdR family protein
MASRCENCGVLGARVKETRENSSSIYRRRACLHCGFRFTTYEIHKKEFDRLQELEDRMAGFSQEFLRFRREATHLGRCLVGVLGRGSE